MPRSKRSGAAPGRNSLLTCSPQFQRQWISQARGGYVLLNSTLMKPAIRRANRIETRRTSLRDTSSRSTTTTVPWMMLNGLLELPAPVRRSWHTRRGHTLEIGRVYAFGFHFRVLLHTMNSKQYLVQLQAVPELNSQPEKATSLRSTCIARRSSRSKSSKVGKTRKARGPTSTKS